MTIKRLNSTGSFMLIDGDYFSYDTRLSFYIGNQMFINKTYYSVTTSKHQSKLPYVNSNCQLHYCPYGNFKPITAIQNELIMLRQELEQRKLWMRKTKNNLLQIEQIHEKIDYLERLVL